MRGSISTNWVHQASWTFILALVRPAVRERTFRLSQDNRSPKAAARRMSTVIRGSQKKEMPRAARITARAPSMEGAAWPMTRKTLKMSV